MHHTALETGYYKTELMGRKLFEAAEQKTLHKELKRRTVEKNMAAVPKITR